MTECEMIQERMPDVVHGRTPWRSSELGHINTCAECAAAWRLVEAGSMLHQDLLVDTDAIALLLRQRIAATSPVTVRALPFRRAGWGILAAAASVALVFGLRTKSPAVLLPSSAATPTAMLPELDRLSETQLETVLTEVDQSDEVVTPMRIPRLGDLSANQLEQMLKELEG